MALVNLALVTSSLKELLEQNINTTYYGGVQTVTVTPEPPDKVGSVENKLSLYMYHLAEEAMYKNLEGPGTGDRNIARTPLGLCLYYILTPHHESASPEVDPLTQQTIMGYALKTLHDYPIVHDGTQIGGVDILQGAAFGADNPLQIIMRPVPAEEAVSFWGAEDQQTARLSAYYEVRVVLLEPDEPTTLATPVLSLGTYLYQLGTPHLERSQSALAFDLPSSAGGAAQIVEASPARVCANPGADPIQNQFELLGHNLLGGKSRQLWLRGGSIASTVSGPLPVDLELANNLGEGWSVAFAGDKIVAQIAETLYYLDSAGAEQSLTLLPGIYTCFERVTVEERVVGEALVAVTNDSNELALAVIPRIASESVNGVSNKVTVTIVASFPLQSAGLEIALYVDGQAYVEAAGTANAGEYEVLSDTQFIFHALFDVTVAGEHALRLLVNGAESAPHWIET